jgi:hypothetical protein
MLKTRSLCALIVGIGLLSSHTSAWAEDLKAAVTATDVNAVHADCMIPQSYYLKYKLDRSKKKLQFVGQKKKLSRNKSATFVTRVVDQNEGVGRSIRTSFNLKRKTVQVTEDAVKLDNSGGSCRFTFSARLS